MKLLKILYVEDNDDLREGILELLQDESRVVVTCATGEQALDAYESNPCDVLVTDVSLPGLSGTDLARRILKRNPQQWVILCSGYDFRYGLAALGPKVRSLPKPFEIDELDALLSEISTDLAANK